MTNAATISRIKQQIKWLEMQEANLRVQGILPAPTGTIRTEEFDTLMFNLNNKITDWAKVEINTALAALNNELQHAINSSL